MAGSHQENGALAGGVGRKELHHVVIVEGQSGGAKLLRVSRQVNSAAQDAGLQLDGAVAAVTETAQPAVQIGQEKHRHRGVSCEVLLERQVGRAAAEIAVLQRLERPVGGTVEIGARFEPFNGVYDEVQVVEPGVVGRQEIGWDGAGRVLQNRG